MDISLKNTSPCDVAASFIMMLIKGSYLLCRNISSAAGRFLQHKCLLGVFWAWLYRAVSGNEVLWQLLLLSQVWKKRHWQHASCWLSAQSATTHHSACSHRYHKMVWGPHRMDDSSHPSGILIAGGENGNVILYDPAKIMAGGSDVVIAESDRHTGPVRALDINPFQVRSFFFMFHVVHEPTVYVKFLFSSLRQTNLVASGGNESEIYIWDLNNFGSPMTPGPKTQVLFWLWICWKHH